MIIMLLNLSLFFYFLDLIFISFHFISIFFFCRSHERTPEELEMIYEELVHITALAHLSNSVKRELASVILFEAHTRAGTVRKFVKIT